ncbi:hypothetical protein LINPERPRIM_LOCUS9359 [Linum perenne]
MLISHRRKPELSSPCCCAVVVLRSVHILSPIEATAAAILTVLYKRTMDFNRLGCVGYDVPVKLGGVESRDGGSQFVHVMMSRNLQQTPKRKNLQASKLCVQVLSVIDKVLFIDDAAGGWGDVQSPSLPHHS